MIIDEIHLINFRNIGEQKIKFSPNLNIILGDNAQGKTSIIEAVYLCAFTKSFRARDVELVKLETSRSTVNTSFVTRGDLELKIDYSIDREGGKIFKINGNKIEKHADLLTNVNIVLFFPDDLKLVKDGPAVRRLFLDREISSISKSYLSDIQQYNRILKHRNNLLKKNAGKDQIEIWTRTLAKTAVPLILKREDYVKSLSKVANEIHRHVSGGKEELSLKYISSVKYSLEDQTKIENVIYTEILNEYQSDIVRGYTTKGPHRDDIEIKINGRTARKYASQGQQRTAALSIRLSEIEIIKNEVGEYPIVLLDDIMSELDKNRQLSLLKATEKTQVILTTTEATELQETYTGEKKIMKIRNGQIFAEEK